MRGVLLLVVLAPACEPEPSFSSVDSDIFVRSCGFSSCHGANTGGMTLGAGSDDYSALVGVPAVGATGETRVIPGDPDNSYLVKKLEGADDIVGVRMPPGAALEGADIERVREWIAAGAIDN